MGNKAKQLTHIVLKGKQTRQEGEVPVRLLVGLVSGKLKTGALHGDREGERRLVWTKTGSVTSCPGHTQVVWRAVSFFAGLMGTGHTASMSLFGQWR